jgi:hypothetical protein
LFWKSLRENDKGDTDNGRTNRESEFGQHREERRIGGEGEEKGTRDGLHSLESVRRIGSVGVVSDLSISICDEIWIG